MLSEIRGGEGTHIWKWRGCADTIPKVGSFGDRLDKEKGVFQWGQKKKRGSFGEDYKKGSFSEDFSLKKKRGHFVRLLILVQNSI